MTGNNMELEEMPSNKVNDVQIDTVESLTRQDPWELPEVQVNYTKWSELSCLMKIKRVAVSVGKTILLLGCLYFFICSLDLLSKSFKLIGGKTAGSVFQNSDVLSNPVAGLMIGVLATVLFQSSSTTTGIAISLAVSKVLTVRDVIPIVMGANIGTSTTNTIVALGQITKQEEFRRAFAGATIHDMFNWMTVIVFLPLEAATGYLYYFTTKAIVASIDFPKSREKRKSLQLLKTITKPFTSQIMQLNKHVLSDIAEGKEGASDKSIIKHCCKWNSYNRSFTQINANISSFENETSLHLQNIPNKICVAKCQFLFESVSWSDTTIGIVLLIFTLIILSACFFTLVRTLYSVMRGPILALIRKFINSDFPGIFRYLTGYIAILIGTGVTMVIQSSSVFTSALTPLVGIGILSLERMYPLTLGANLGTTFTAIIIALSQNADDMPIAFHVALRHVFFNISGVLLYYPIYL
ncbi:sodium-dependent phosphate transport protein 2B-like [Ruditapes philippinarum]|uniref:sodium-dependent phosphate transport protein 2B-like n=1 Tax=Ruditapes philippinarum TaxID=129788 RepID=UPI00295B625F|nr:sodium-dependent phosphate transport protein 2B-like [Ruditapes philippinarum]